MLITMIVKNENFYIKKMHLEGFEPPTKGFGSLYSIH